MIQKPLLWVEVGKSACVLVGICELRLSLPARYDPQCPSLLDFLSGCLVRVLWTCRSSTDPARDVEQITPYHRAFLFLIKTTVTIATRVLSCGRIVNLFPGLCSSMAQPVFLGSAMKTIKVTFRLLSAFSRRNCLLVGAGATPAFPPVVIKDCTSQKSSNQPRRLWNLLQDSLFHPFQVSFRKNTSRERAMIKNRP